MFAIWVQNLDGNVMTCEAKQVTGFLALCQTEKGDWQAVYPKNYTPEQVKAIAKAFYDETQKGTIDARASGDRKQAEPRGLHSPDGSHP